MNAIAMKVRFLYTKGSFKTQLVCIIVSLLTMFALTPFAESSGGIVVRALASSNMTWVRFPDSASYHNDSI